MFFLCLNLKKCMIECDYGSQSYHLFYYSYRFKTVMVQVSHYLTMMVISRMKITMSNQDGKVACCFIGPVHSRDHIDAYQSGTQVDAHKLEHNGCVLH